jgi:hypothetical protein
MLVMRIELAEEEWQRVLAILAQAPWNQVNPLIMKIGAQMQAQQGTQGVRPDGAGADPTSASAH